MLEHLAVDDMESAAASPPTAARRGETVALQALLWCSFGSLVLPAVAVSGTPVHARPMQVVVATAIAVLVFAFAARIASSLLTVAAGIAMTGVACWLLAQTSYPVAAWLIAPVLGAGCAMALGGLPFSRLPLALGPALFGAAILVMLRAAWGREAALAAGAAVVAASVVPALLTSPSIGAPRWRSGGVAVTGVAFTLVVTAYVGATTPSVTWFGSLIHHGPRASDMVAITFDDGPDAPFTQQIAGILDENGAKGTFFTVGKALDAEPEVSKALLDDGHLLGNHSYHHDAFSWLDPRYPELDRTEDAFKRNLGVCPALFRPPHGSHTPFMAHVVGDRGMKMVTWDVSAADWATDDGDLVARRVLGKVKPGSIILLHDGSDGNVGADRSVILTALPQILQGLRERGLRPVTLDKLLGVPGYLPNC